VVADNQPMKPSIKHILLLALTVLTSINTSASSYEELIEWAVNHPDRPDFDIERDVNRKPHLVLEFFDVRPGMTVVDVFSGDGYYTELLSYVVGPQGVVIAHNNQAYLDYAQKTLSRRFAEGRLSNVKRITAEANQLELAENSADIVFLILAYHDIYYRPKKGSWPAIDRDDFLARLYRILKPGGVLAVIDHHAEPDAPASTGNELHRISSKLVKRELSAAGFVLKEEAYFLENPEDDLKKHMYAAEIRGKTSRFVLKFYKPLNIDKQLVEDKPIP
jgi:predicted methyltransferase